MIPETRCGHRPRCVAWGSVAVLWFVLACIGPTVAVRACGLAEHDWQILGYLEIPLEAPFVLVAEQRWLEETVPCREPVPLLWVFDKPEAAAISGLAHCVLANWQLDRPFVRMAALAGGILEMARNAEQRGKPLVIAQACRPRLRLAWLYDWGSGGRCHQWLVLHDTVLRAVLAGHTNRWAEEHPQSLAMSVTFDQVPWPTHVLNATLGPDQVQPWWSYSSEPLVRALIEAKVIRMRQGPPDPTVVLDRPPLPGDAAPVAAGDGSP